MDPNRPKKSLFQSFSTALTRDEIEAFTKAALAGDDLTIRTLLAYHPKILDKQNGAGWTALDLAARGNQVKTVALLLERGAKIDARDSSGRTALIWAAWEGHTETVAFLLKKGATTEVSSDTGKTALIYAAETGRKDTVICLLENGANIHAKSKPVKISGRLAIDWTARDWAIQAGKKEVAELLDQWPKIKEERERAKDYATIETIIRGGLSRPIQLPPRLRRKNPG